MNKIYEYDYIMSVNFEYFKSSERESHTTLDENGKPVTVERKKEVIKDINDKKPHVYESKRVYEDFPRDINRNVFYNPIGFNRNLGMITDNRIIGGNNKQRMPRGSGKCRGIPPGSLNEDGQVCLPPFKGDFHVRDYGWNSDDNDRKRHAALLRASRAIGIDKVMRHMDMAAKLNKNKQQGEILEKDTEYLRETLHRNKKYSKNNNYGKESNDDISGGCNSFQTSQSMNLKIDEKIGPSLMPVTDRMTVPLKVEGKEMIFTNEKPISGCDLGNIQSDFMSYEQIENIIKNSHPLNVFTMYYDGDIQAIALISRDDNNGRIYLNGFAANLGFRSPMINFIRKLSKVSSKVPNLIVTDKFHDDFWSKYGSNKDNNSGYWILNEL